MKLENPASRGICYLVVSVFAKSEECAEKTVGDIKYTLSYSLKFDHFKINENEKVNIPIKVHVRRAASRGYF